MKKTYVGDTSLLEDRADSEGGEGSEFGGLRTSQHLGRKPRRRLTFKTVQLPVQRAGASFHAIIKKGNCRPKSARLIDRARRTHVPGNDLTDNTDRLVDSIGQLVRINIDDLASVLVGPTTVVSERGGSLHDVERSSNGVGLAVVEGLQRGEFIGVFFDQFGDLDKDLASFLTRDVFYEGVSGLQIRRTESTYHPRRSGEPFRRP